MHSRRVGTERAARRVTGRCLQREQDLVGDAPEQERLLPLAERLGRQASELPRRGLPQIGRPTTGGPVHEPEEVLGGAPGLLLPQSRDGLTQQILDTGVVGVRSLCVPAVNGGDTQGRQRSGRAPEQPSLPQQLEIQDHILA